MKSDNLKTLTFKLVTLLAWLCDQSNLEFLLLDSIDIFEITDNMCIIGRRDPNEN